MLQEKLNVEDREIGLTVPVGALTLGCEVTAFASCISEDVYWIRFAALSCDPPLIRI